MFENDILNAAANCIVETCDVLGAFGFWDFFPAGESPKGLCSGENVRMLFRSPAFLLENFLCFMTLFSTWKMMGLSA